MRLARDRVKYNAGCRIRRFGLKNMRSNVDRDIHDNQPVTAGNDQKVTGADKAWIERGMYRGQ